MLRTILYTVIMFFLVVGNMYGFLHEMRIIVDGRVLLDIQHPLSLPPSLSLFSIFFLLVLICLFCVLALPPQKKFSFLSVNNLE